MAKEEYDQAISLANKDLSGAKKLDLEKSKIGQSYFRRLAKAWGWKVHEALWENNQESSYRETDLRSEASYLAGPGNLPLPPRPVFRGRDTTSRRTRSRKSEVGYEACRRSWASGWVGKKSPLSRRWRRRNQKYYQDVPNFQGFSWAYAPEDSQMRRSAPSVEIWKLPLPV